jgi:hypothetical protein
MLGYKVYIKFTVRNAVLLFCFDVKYVAEGVGIQYNRKVRTEIEPKQGKSKRKVDKNPGRGAS